MTRASASTQALWAQMRPEWGRWVISWKLWVAFAIPRLLGTWALLWAPGTTSMLRSAIAMLLAYAASGLVLALSALTVLRHRLTTPPRISVVLAVWFTSGLVMVTVGGWLVATSAGLAYSVSPAEAARFALLHTLKIAVPVVAVCLLSFGIRKARQLRQSVTARQALVEQAANHLTSLRERHLDALRTGLMPRFHDLSGEVSDLLAESPDRELGDLPERIESFGRGEVRDLSHRVARGEFLTDVGASLGVPDRTERVGAFIASAFSSPAPAILAAGLYVFLAIGWSDVAMTRDSLGVLALQVIVILLVVTGVRYLCSALAHRGAGVTMTLTVSCLVVTTAAVAWVEQPQSLAAALTPLVQASSALAGSLLLAGAYRQQRATLEALTLAQTALAAQIDDLRREAERIRHRIAALLHGTIQGRLALTSLRLTELRDLTDPVARAHARAEVLALLASIEAEFRAAELDSAPADPTLDDTLTAIARDWAGLLRTTWSIEPDARAALRTRPLLSGEIGDIITEAVSNARRHGSAHAVSIEVDVAGREPLMLRITVTDDGDGPDITSRPGLGHTMLATLGARWALVRDERGRTVLVVVLRAPDENPTSGPGAPALELTAP